MKILLLSDFLPNSDCKFSSHFCDLLKSSDCVVFNLEGSPLLPIDGENVPHQIMPFQVSSLIEFLNQYGKEKFYIALSNNHILDNGLAGFDYLIQKLEENDIKYFGTKSRPYVTIGGVQILNLVTAETVANKRLGKSRLNYLFYNTEDVNKQIRHLESLGDKLIFYPHWGRDMDTEVFKTFDKKIKFAKEWLTFGHHTHVITGVEQNKIYSMGNSYIPHPYYFKKYPATRFGLAVLLDHETMRYNLLLTSLRKSSDKYIIEVEEYKGLPTPIANHGKDYSRFKKIFLRLFAFRGNYFDWLTLSALQMMSRLFSFKYKLTKK